MRRAGALAAAALAAALVVAGARPAAAHATLETTAPGADALVREPPRAVELWFSEPVDPGLGGVKVIGPDGGRADRGRVERRQGGRLLRAPVDALVEGTYTVAWSVVSDDGHPVAGSFVFSVGRVTGAAGAATGPRAGLESAAAGSRWVAYAGILLAAGALAFAFWVGPLVPEGRRRLRWLVAAAAATAVVGSALVMVTRVALASGRPVLDSLRLVGDAAAHTRIGRLDLARVVLALVTLGLAGTVGGGRRSRVAAVAAGGSVAGLLVVTALGGHAWSASSRWVAVATDVVHLGAASVWVGGLASLAVLAAGGRVGAAAVRRFSSVALAAVGAVALTGAVAGYLQVRTRAALTETGYGRVLVAKVVVVALMVALGWAARRRARTRPEAVFEVVRAELATAAVVLALTAVLVARVPANAALSEPFAATVAMRGDPGGGRVEVSVVPARVGRNDVHLYFVDARFLPRPVDAVELRVAQAGVPARRVRVIPVTRDHAVATGVLLPAPGRWTLTVVAVRTSVTSTASVEVPIR